MSEYNIHKISTDSHSLDKRITENKKSESVDFIKWVFDRVSVTNDMRILELCCGTGAQTLEFCRRIGVKGHIVAIDISKESLEKLNSKIPSDKRDQVTLIESDIDTYDVCLKERNFAKKSFDVFFCSYGLYYSKDAKKILDIAKTWLKPQGQIIIVGPYGPNNDSLFSLLASSGVTIPEFVVYTSQDFMTGEVIPWATLNFDSIRIFCMVNNIKWNSSENVMSYWKNSTFFDPNYAEIVERNITDHFKASSRFINQKWVMMVVMANDSP
jgi:ubiquinone/menaquinone biosynthesis C-methylase UbiE